MKRLTKKNNLEILKDGDDPELDDYQLLCDCYKKLGKLEDLEEEIGCPFEVLLQLLNQYRYYDKNGKCVRLFSVEYHPIEKAYIITSDDFDEEKTEFLKNYKKTWWLEENLKK